MDVISSRSERFYQKQGKWYFTTREGIDMGPYDDKAEVQMALMYFVERTQWPDNKQLRDYMGMDSQHLRKHA